MSIRQLSVLVFAVVLGSVQVLYAADREPFFPTNSARDVLTEDVLISKEPGIEYFRQKPQAEVVEKEEETAALQPAGAPSLIRKPAGSIEEIVKKHGNPDESVPVLAVETAPRPYQAMMEAKAAGFDDLAYQYAKQYARYMRDMRERTSYVTALTGKAMQVEGMLPKDAWPSDPRFDEQQRFVEKDLEKAATLEKIDSEHEARLSSLDPESKDMFERALREEGRLEGAKEHPEDRFSAGKVKPEEFNEARERAKVRAAYTGKVPRAADGRVDLFVFFRPSAANSVEVLKDAQKLFQSYRGVKGVNVMGIVFDNSSVTELGQVKIRAGANFPIRAGADLAARLGVRESPTFVVKTPQSDEITKINGSRQFYFLDEVIKTMRGER